MIAYVSASCSGLLQGEKKNAIAAGRNVGNRCLSSWYPEKSSFDILYIYIYIYIIIHNSTSRHAYALAA